MDVQKENWQDDLELICDAARQAGEIALGFFGQSPEVWWKNEGRSPVSAADFAANDRLQSLLLKARPNYGWLSEETDDDAARLSCETLFVIDPIDGTRAFINGEKTWCVSVAVVHRGRPVAGVLVAPALEEEFSAVRNGPALKNGEPIAVSEPRSGEPLSIAAAEEMVKKLEQDFRRQIHRIRHVPSLAYRLAMVAEGRIDGTIVRRNSHDWDLVAADLILERAGGRLVDLDDRPLVYNREAVTHGMLCAGAEHALDRLMRHLVP
ncbi:3'(2'),5'-bisphosphate nucleotidase CysQ [Rhizobium sp. LCM 4573]|uniref:3'(2'),5'-bisphosphate nucleotidase CysQ n=1 Tax=Rhizobium sp. LCM 4573 TaxID=1848291 RepID=UPI0008DADE0A|nr:3'(2'),5'-bisphosphate nucleotidase CysQ [Rhizobium sp. LCM 4573]OHV75855.1 3'(2'),5'-bisphosphate nucleotidase CysQ [Rhizobium sp. LCM 4573]